MAKNRFFNLSANPGLASVGPIKPGGFFGRFKPGGRKSLASKGNFFGVIGPAGGLGHDLKNLQDLITQELGQTSLPNRGLSPPAQERIMAKAEKLRAWGKISLAGKQELGQLVSRLGLSREDSERSGRQSARPKIRARASRFVTSDEIAQEKLFSKLASSADDSSTKSNEKNVVWPQPDQRKIDLESPPLQSSFGRPTPKTVPGKSTPRPLTPEPKTAAAGLPETKNLPDMEIG